MSVRLQHTPEIGSVVECIHNDKILIAIIQDIRASSFYLYTSTNREIKMNENRILPWVGPTYPKTLSRNEYSSILQQALITREEIKSNLDIHELWECIVDDISKAKVEDLAPLLTDNPTPDFLAALGRALLEHKEYFKLANPYFEIYSKETYQIRKAQQEAQQQKQLLSDTLKYILTQLLDSINKNIPLTLESLDISEEYSLYFKELLLAKINHSLTQEQENLWKEITLGIQEERTLPILLGQTLQIIPKHYNIFAHTVGYLLEDSWEEPYTEEIERLSQITHSHTYIDIPFLSIDSETTKDIDDAFYLEEITQDCYRLHFAIALPVESWDYKSELHKEVLTRATSLYLPEKTYNMLPRLLSEEVYSIRANETKNILYISLDITPSGTILSTHVSVATTKIAENTTYKKAEEELNSSSSHSWLQTAYTLAKGLQEKRLNNGGILIKREEHTITLSSTGEDYHITIEQGISYPKSQLLVSELMILANTAIVQFAKEHSIPLIHRVQECSTPTGSQRIWERPEEIHSVMKTLTSVSLNVSPKRHSALGILGYATITSPLRRLVDFINEEQIYSWCIEGTPRYSEDALSAMIPLIQRNTEQSLSIQRFRTRYWKLCFLKQHEGEWFTGIFVEDSNFIYIYLPLLQFTVKAKHSLCGNKCILGESVSVRCIVNPLQNDITVVELR